MLAPAPVEYINHRPFHRTGSAFTPVGAAGVVGSLTLPPNAVYRYPPRSAPPGALSLRTFPARSNS